MALKLPDWMQGSLYGRDTAEFLDDTSSRFTTRLKLYYKIIVIEGERGYIKLPISKKFSQK